MQWIEKMLNIGANNQLKVALSMIFVHESLLFKIPSNYKHAVQT